MRLKIIKYRKACRICITVHDESCSSAAYSIIFHLLWLLPSCFWGYPLYSTRSSNLHWFNLLLNTIDEIIITRIWTIVSLYIYYWNCSDNATRVCQPNGTWANYSNYRSCVPLSSDFGGATPEYGVGISEDTTTIYFTGYTVSIVALTLAIWIFIHFKLVEFLFYY